MVPREQPGVICECRVGITPVHQWMWPRKQKTSKQKGQRDLKELTIAFEPVHEQFHEFSQEQLEITPQLFNRPKSPTLYAISFWLMSEEKILPLIS